MTILYILKRVVKNTKVVPEEKRNEPKKQREPRENEIRKENNYLDELYGETSNL